jgi:hypothetical protein
MILDPGREGGAPVSLEPVTHRVDAPLRRQQLGIIGPITLPLGGLSLR